MGLVEGAIDGRLDGDRVGVVVGMLEGILDRRLDDAPVDGLQVDTTVGATVDGLEVGTPPSGESHMGVVPTLSEYRLEDRKQNG